MGQVTFLLAAIGSIFTHAGDSDALIIPLGNSVVLGSTPRLPSLSVTAVLGPKQLAMVSGGQLLKATLP